MGQAAGVVFGTGCARLRCAVYASGAPICPCSPPLANDLSRCPPALHHPYPAPPTLRSPYLAAPTLRSPYLAIPTLRNPYPATPTLRSPYPAAPTQPTPANPTLGNPHPATPTLRRLDMYAVSTSHVCIPYLACTVLASPELEHGLQRHDSW